MWTLEQVQDYVRDKNIILVGNNTTAIKNPYGSLIDSYDLVLRFGKGIDVKGYEKQLGQKTDIWITNYFRLPTLTRKHLKKPPLVVINGPPPMGIRGEVGPELVRQIDYQMYEGNEIKLLQKKWFAEEELKRHVKISSGTLTALWLANVVTTYKSITLINFDFFKKGVPFYNGSHNALAVATSWHLSIAKPNYADFSSVKNMLTHHPSHIGDKEKEMLKPIFQRSNVHVYGDLPEEHEYITAPGAPWDSARRPLDLKTFEAALTKFNPEGSMEKYEVLVKKRK